MIQGKIGPREGFKIGARRRHRRPLQGDIFEYLRAAGLAFFIELFRGCLQGLEDRRAGRRLVRFFGGLEPTTQRLSARFEACRRLALCYDGRNAFQIVIELTEMIQCMDEPDKTRAYRAEVSGFDLERFEEVFGLLDRFDRRVVLDRFTGQSAADCFDRATSNLQDRPPGGLERDRRSRLGNGRIETADSRLAAFAGLPVRTSMPSRRP